MLPARILAASDRAAQSGSGGRGLPIAAWSYAALVLVLSVAPVQNLWSSQQIMNTSYDRLNLVNTYGMFGSVGKFRDEIVFEGTNSAIPDESAEWLAYDWKCKPGDPGVRPCWITPYHLRLDWLIWFAAMSDYQRNPWVVHLVWKLLQADPGTLQLLGGDPFAGAPPRFVRADLYRYEFTEASDETSHWWRRHRLRSYLPAMDADNASLRGFLAQRGWIPR
jgi:hypothetical protein